MYMEQISSLYLPIEWYIAKIDYYEKHLSNLNDIRIGKHSGATVLRVYSDKTKFKEYSKKSPDWSRIQTEFRHQQVVLNEINKLKSELKSIYHISYENERHKYRIIKDTNSKLNMDFYNQLIDNECRYDNEYNYNLDGHKFRSRFEYSVAQEIKDIRLNYKYDCGIHLYTKKAFVDFTFAFPEFNRCLFLEIMGMLNVPEYAERAANKIKNYSLSGYYPGKDLFIIGSDDKSMPSNDTIRLTIINAIRTLCSLYVVKITDSVT